MAKIFEFNANKGSLIDQVSGTIGTLTAGAGRFVKTEKGMALNCDGASTKLDTGITYTAQPLTGDKTFVAWIKPRGNGESNFGTICSNGSLIFCLNDSGNRIRFSRGTTAVYSTADSIIFNKSYFLVITSTSAGVSSFYIDGSLNAANQASGTVVAGINNLIIGNNNAGSITFDGLINDVQIYDTILTQQEINKLYADFLASKPISKPKRGFIKKVAPAVNTITSDDFSSEPADGTNVVPLEWSQISGTTKIGEINITQGALTSSFVLAGITGVSATGYTHAYVGGSGTKNVACGNPAYAGVLGKSYVAKFKLTITSGALSSPIQISGMGSALTNITSGYNTYTMHGSNGSNGSYFTVNSTTDCTYTISEFSLTEIEPLQTVKQGTKYLEQATAGVTAIPSNTAYGTWEMDFYKGATANDIRIHFIAGSTALYPNYSGVYIFRCSDTENLTLNKGNMATASALIVSADNYIKNNTWYRIRITRSALGVFTMLIKGGTFTPTAGQNGWTLVSVTGGSGTNPVTSTDYTTSNYLVLDLDSLDRVANINIKDGIIT